MPHILKNNNLEIHIDLPEENYTLSRFDWTGKIRKVKFQDIVVSGVERTDWEEGRKGGEGFYNEFGIDAPVGYAEAEVGGWFPKIGIGLLKKEEQQYLFSKDYTIKPCLFKITTKPDKIILTCTSQETNDYSYVLKKEIELLENGFIIRYDLKNTGVKTIVTNEYNHNFLAINKTLIGREYILKFPFQIKPELFGETVNPEQKVDIRQKEITFNGTPNEPFFFSNLTGGETVEAGWELINIKSKIGIKEIGSFQTNKINLWGWRHVVSPEVFFSVVVRPGQSTIWSRRYRVYKIA